MVPCAQYVVRICKIEELYGKGEQILRIDRWPYYRILADVRLARTIVSLTVWGCK
jgi:hypothetical protein